MEPTENPPALFDMPPQPFAPPPARRGFRRVVARMRKPRRAVLVSLTVAALAATGGVALAAANGSNTSPAPGGGPGMRAAHGVVHGEFTVADGKGGYRTELMQRGTVTSFTGGTLTVKSTDGYTHSYSTDSTTRFGGMHGNGTAAATPTATVGENVTVIAIHGGNTDHAQRVMPMRQNGPGGFFGHRRGGMMGRQFRGMQPMPGQPGMTAPVPPAPSTPSVQPQSVPDNSSNSDSSSDSGNTDSQSSPTTDS
jgi:hypothetical protein